MRRYLLTLPFLTTPENTTAIPPFIGYTGKDIIKGSESLLVKLTEINSLVEYQLLFGGRPPPYVESLVIGASNNVDEATLSDKAKFYTYDSLQLFFNNCGRICNVV